jgi:hypothetical protein
MMKDQALRTEETLLDLPALVPARPTNRSPATGLSET